MIFRLLITSIHNNGRISSITQFLHATTWSYFNTSPNLPDRFIRSPKVVKEAIMADISDLVQEFSTTSSDGVTGAPFFAMRHLFKFLQQCFETLEVCFDIISVFAAAVNLVD